MVTRKKSKQIEKLHEKSQQIRKITQNNKIKKIK